MTGYYPDLGSASDWSIRVGNLLQPNRTTPQIWVVTVIRMKLLRPFVGRHVAGK